MRAVLFVIYIYCASYYYAHYCIITHIYSLKYTPVKGLILYNIDGPQNMVNLMSTVRSLAQQHFFFAIFP